MDRMGAAAAARAMAPNGGITNEPYRTRAAKRKADREAALASSVRKSMEQNELLQSARSKTVTDEERRAWEMRTERAQRALDARREERRAPAPKRASRPAPKPSRLYSPEMACDAARDTRLMHGAARCFQLIHAVQRGQLPRPTKRWLAEQLGVSQRTVQRYLRQLRELGYIAVEEIRTATGWMVGQVVRVTKKALPFFRRFAPKNGMTLGETVLSPIQIPPVSESTSRHRPPENPNPIPPDCHGEPS
jgi:DNA-binding transcriptional ArsR family regulator